MPWRRTVAVLLALVAGPGNPLAAQVVIRGPAAIRLARPGRGADPDTELAESVFVLPERSLLQQLTRAQELLKNEHYVDAVKLLDGLLAAPEDFFFQPDKDSPVHRSLKAEAQRLIGQMPPEGRELYQLHCGRRPQQMLDDAILSGSPDGLAEVSRRYFHTPAGYEATFLLGLDHFDHGRPLAAALTLKRLCETTQATDQFEPALSLFAAASWAQAGAVDKAREVLQTLKQRQGDAPLRIAGKQKSLFPRASDPAVWLADIVGPQRAGHAEEPDRWAMFRGNPARNAATHGSAPVLNLLWEIPIGNDDPSPEEPLRQLRQWYAEQDLLTLPGLHPLVVDDVVLMRTVRTLLAVDFQTGKRLWEIPVDDKLEGGLNPSSIEAMLRQQQPQLAGALGQRMWFDATFGTLSSDGRCVYSIEDLTLGPTVYSGRAIIMGPQRVSPAAPGQFNRLAAHDIRSGKLQWHLGGPSDQFALPQAETFFLGPPLPLMGQLYVLAESKAQGAIVLLAIDGDPKNKGKVLWSQPLAIVEREVFEDPLRRLSGASPSYADGILVCPTSAGAIVAVDLATRSLLWGYRYARNDVPNRYQPFVIVNAGGYYGGSPSSQRWVDGAAIVADGRVLVGPSESDSLHCLSLIDGKLLWTLPRQDDLYVACVDQGKVVLAGRRGVRAFSLTETVTQNERVVRQEQTPQGSFQQRTVEVAVVRPKPAWEARVLALPEGSAPSGRGFLSDHRYFLPLTSAEVLAIDVQSGRIDHASKSRSGTVPGNLICYKGKVISQGFDRVEKFYQADAARDEVDRLLAANPDDPKALALRGEMLLDQDQQDEAVACFRRACEMDHDERTRALLRDALLDGLRRHFAEYRGRAAEIEPLLDDATQRAVYLRLMAAGWQQSGQWLAALQQYEKLIDLDPANRKLEAISPAQSVRRDRWVQAQLAALRSEIKDEQAAGQLDRAIQARLEAALKAGDVDALRQFIDYFGNQTAAAAARRELVRRLADSDRMIEAELTLWSDQQSRDPAVAGPALAQLAALLRKAGRDEDAAACYQRLGRDFAAVVCLDGKTGQQLVGALPDALRQPAVAAPPWPTGQVEFGTPRPSGPRQQNYGRFAFPYEGTPAPFFTDTKVVFDQSRRAIVGYDGWGNERWQVSLSEVSQQNNFFFGARNMTQLSAHGDLLLVAMGLKLVAVDGSGRGDRRAPRLLWDRDLSTPGLDGNAALPFGVPILAGPFRVSSYRSNRLNSRMSAVGPSTSRYICFQQFKNLVALEPLSGNVLWIDRNVPPGSELFGDDEYVFALPPNQTEALVFRALDGQPLGKKSVPRVDVNQAMGDDRAAARIIEVMPPAASVGGPLKYLPLGQSCLATLGRRLLIWRLEGINRVLEMYDPWEQRQVWPPRKFAATAQADVVDDEAVGICEPDGHFVLLSLPEGKMIVDTKLNVKAGFSSLAQLVLWQDDERYLVVTHNPQNVLPNPPRNIQPLPNVVSQPITRGWVWAFDKQGKPAWPEPVMVRDQQLPLDQPRRVPVVVFACQEFVRQSNNAMRNQTAVLCIDKRTGRKITPERLQIQPNGVFDIVGDPKKHTVELRFQQNTLAMTFTDKPWPAEPPPVEEGASPAKADGKKAARSLWGSVKRAMGGLVPGGPDFLPEDLFEEEERLVPPPAPPPLR